MKRIFDITLIVIFSPVLLLLFFFLSLTIFIFQGSPIFFKQKRPGKKGKVFTLIKYRTMIPQASSVIDDSSERVTSLGRILRKYSLDEIPSIINVFKGEMSLVGPRPLLIEYLERYDKNQRRRHDVLPGITGHAQVSGRNSISWEEKFELDIEYVDNYSIYFDIKILFKTVINVVRSQNIDHDENKTMPIFEKKEES